MSGHGDRGLLSRIAETLYWIGRYVERADDTSRLLDVSVHRLLEEPWRDEDEACRALFAILGIQHDRPERLSVATLIDRLAFDVTDPSAIAGCLRSVRESARGVREIISSEAWECLNVTWHQLPARQAAADRLGPHGYLRYVRERAALFFGLTDATMSRDDGWRFIVLGRSLERVDMTARLLAAHQHGDRRLLLQACGADESFTRTHGGGGDMERVLEFLLLDRLFPRSVMHALATAEELLAELVPDTGRAGVTDAARAAVGRARMELTYADADSLGDGLPELLVGLQEACVVASEAISERFFRHNAPGRWEREGQPWAGV
ncbi:putative alpha-E superfamily protein [Thermocatellispora tengchongensis]|uniref:Putative alpha-E superfamily protein n=1 Tax=Thermocatellispora tengchongensis TaxID=1073253 RepID=A0A840PF93_9ACTN|nr:alpha-E domain-containing protein [Thermocatellispora tengchongensis]MBB5136511.1 putative alpha-E superfamily protein [Thermocatellispora tengchongensis]